jgi:MFS family permease
VGALVIATGFPHLLKAFTTSLPWRSVLMTTSCLAVLGGLLMFLLVPNGPHRKPGQQLNLSVIFTVFKNVKLRSAAFGYFGHMWELYAFWAFVPVILTTYTALHPGITFNIPVFSFLIIGIGGISCFIGGYLSQSFGEKRIASIALFFSGLCCVISPLMFFIPSGIVFILFLLFWGMMITADSPLFSTLVAKNALAETKGTSLTIVNCIGFSITIVSIQLLNLLITSMDARYIYTVLAIGPALGLIALYRKK